MPYCAGRFNCKHALLALLYTVVYWIEAFHTQSRDVTAPQQRLSGNYSGCSLRIEHPNRKYPAMPRLFTSLIAVGLLSIAPAFAQDRPVVVELYTSQGCSSCPPADEMFAELSKRDDVIALALHVDYWDYIGWQDPFGAPEHAERQRAYALTGGRTSIYTPEMIVNGQSDVVGAKPMKLMEAINKHKEDAPQVDLSIARDGETLRINAHTVSGAAGPFDVHMLRYHPMAVTQVKRGENAGHTFENYNIVEGWQTVDQWDGQAPLSLSAAITGDMPVVVLVQRSNAGPIVAAARIK